MKKEWIWLAASFPISILVIGIMTDFNFRNLEIQLHDTYFVIDPVRAVIYLALGLWMIRSMYLLIDLMTTRYKILALFVAIINPLIALFIVILMSAYIQQVNAFNEIYPQADFAARLVPLAIMGGVITLQTVLEIITLKKLWQLIKQ